MHGQCFATALQSNELGVEEGVVVQSNAALALDFERVWIDASSFQWLSLEGTDSSAIERWLDRYYHNHLLVQIGTSKIIEDLRQRLAGQAERANSDTYAKSVQLCDDSTSRRLERRWKSLFPQPFS